MSNNQFYHIKSPHVITWIQQKLYSIGYLRSDCRLKVICDGEGNETKRTLAFIHPSVYEELVQWSSAIRFQDRAVRHTATVLPESKSIHSSTSASTFRRRGITFSTGIANAASAINSTTHKFTSESLLHRLTVHHQLTDH